MNNTITAIVASDSTGETGFHMARAWLTQFESIDYDILRRPMIDSEDKVLELIEEISNIDGDKVVISSVVEPDISKLLLYKLKNSNIPVIDLFSSALDVLSSIIGKEPIRKKGLTRELDVDYFSKIDCIEFAVKYDDGKDSRGLTKADIVLVGVSRTSKTPLSMLLATKGYKVANLPLVPEIPVPQEIYQVDKNKIIGLVISKEHLNHIREERLKVLGLNTSSQYSKDDRIEKELEYAKDLFNKLGCEVMDVSSRTIEQSASYIIRYIEKNS